MEVFMDAALEEIRDIRLWIETGEMNLEEIEVQLDWIIENGLAMFISDEEPEAALAAFTLLDGFLSAAAAQRPSLVKTLSLHVQEFKTSARALGKELKVDSVSVAVGFPWGVSINLSWNV